MRISGLIEGLRSIAAQHGDLDVFVADGDDGEWPARLEVAPAVERAETRGTPRVVGYADCDPAIGSPSGTPIYDDGRTVDVEGKPERLLILAS